MKVNLNRSSKDSSRNAEPASEMRINDPKDSNHVSLPYMYADRDELALFHEKAKELAAYVLSEDVTREIGNAPAGSIKHAVFFSICDTKSRAHVYHGIGETPEAAWNAALLIAETALSRDAIAPVWVKADIVCDFEEISLDELCRRIKASRHEFFRYGIALDRRYETALLEAELNGAKILLYDEGGIDLQYLNRHLKRSDQTVLAALPEVYTVFRTRGWLCDETGEILPLAFGRYDTGRRQVSFVDRDMVQDILENATDFLLRQVKEDGSFIYGYYPRFDNELKSYNIVRHASTIWSLLCRYRMQPSEKLKATIEKTIEYLLRFIRYKDENTAYLYESKADEIKLGGCGVTVVALTEYMDIFESEKYVTVCRKLGEGIFSMMDREKGTYKHVLNGDFTEKDAYRTVYYDGEATFALSRLYGLTGDQKYLDAACAAVDHFIKANYTQYKDHWIAYTMNEITKHVTDREDYYAFALENAQANLDEICKRDTTYHTYLELLMASFEVYDRLDTLGADIDGLDLKTFMKTIRTRTVHMLNGYFFPEYAMYMKNPSRIIGTFMVRHDGYRVRIDDVQHNIGGYYLYYKNYYKLLSCGMGEDIN